jgi:hypothetical protein
MFMKFTMKFLALQFLLPPSASRLPPSALLPIHRKTAIAKPILCMPTFLFRYPKASARLAAYHLQQFCDRHAALAAMAQAQCL